MFLIGQIIKNQSNEILLAQLLEIFKFSTYEETFGDIPEYFIRVNSVTVIERILSNPNYKSEMVQLVEYRHNESQK